MTEITVEEWALKVDSDVDVIKHPDSKNMKEFLEGCGADFSEADKIRNSLGKNTNEGNTEAMKLIYGEERWRYFVGWAKKYVYQYESVTGKRQKRTESGKVGSGEIRMLCLMTKLAADTNYSEARFSIEVGVRRKNGELRDRGELVKKLRKLSRPDTGEVYRPGSFPPGYIDALVFEMKTWRK